MQPRWRAKNGCATAQAFDGASSFFRMGRGIRLELDIVANEEISQGRRTKEKYANEEGGWVWGRGKHTSKPPSIPSGGGDMMRKHVLARDWQFLVCSWQCNEWGRLIIRSSRCGKVSNSDTTFPPQVRPYRKGYRGIEA